MGFFFSFMFALGQIENRNSYNDRKRNCETKCFLELVVSRCYFANPLFCSLSLLFGDVLVGVPVVVC